VQVISVPVRSAADIESALAGFSQQSNSGLALPTFGIGQQRLVADLAARYRLPSIGTGTLASDGGLMDLRRQRAFVAQFGQAASYVDRILKSAKPADLPVQADPVPFCLINLKTAKALGLTIPERLLATADQVIE
jgi:putative ABC transport system substrate-binding protein